MHYLWEFPNGTTILNPSDPVTINSEYNITINLKAPFAIIESLLCHISAFMLSAKSTPKYEYIHPVYGRIVGTGPFRYLYYIADREVRFERFDDYWGGPAFFEDVTFAIIKDATTRNNAMLSHTIDYLIGSMYSLYPTFDADQTIKHQSGIGSLDYYYLGMNNEVINKTWRQAISYAINYTSIIELFYTRSYYKNATRSNGPLAPQFPMYDSTIQAATYNVSKAREIVVSMGFGDMSWTDAQWQAASFATWNFTYSIGNDFREDLAILLKNNLELVGVTVINEGWSWSDFIWRPKPPPPTEWWTKGFYWVGWNPDILSPFNAISVLFSNKSYYYPAKYHDHNVEMWLEEVLQETNRTNRKELYSTILRQIVEIDMPHVFGCHSYQHSVHSADIYNVLYNAKGCLSIYPMYRGLN
jgi:ABC-type transport system substrate-binding protein